MQADIGLIGLAVMGENLALNMASKGFCVAVYNRSTDKVDNFVSGRGKGASVIGTHSLAELVQKVKKPRKIMLMVRAGAAVDETVEKLLPYLSKGDLIVDGGNSNYLDTVRRVAALESKGLYYLGTGVSGGEEGALRGPSMMVGGSYAGWEMVKPVFTAIAANVGGRPCCDYMGPDGAGHFVKMVHNGIEYGDMQLICEVYQLLKDTLGMTNDEMSGVFSNWNQTELGSYLIEITADILGYRDGEGFVVDRILDKAGQKGTGKWAVGAALEFGSPLSLITEAVLARCLSAQKDERTRAAAQLKGVKPHAESVKTEREKQDFAAKLKNALYLAKIISYAQGFSLLREASKAYRWRLDLGNIALIWRGGCIIRSVFLNRISQAYDGGKAPENLLLDDFFQRTAAATAQDLRDVCVEAVKSGVPVPSLSAALAYLDGYTAERLPHNLLQAQRDYFGAHTYERTDRPGEIFHTDWTGRGGKTVSEKYNV